MEEREVRLGKLQQLREMGVDPYGQVVRQIQTIGKVRQNAVDGDTCRVMARVTSIRQHGKLTFADLKDFTGKLQISFRKDILGDKYDFFKRFIDVGDVIYVEGTIYHTGRGELTLDVTDFTLQSKCLRPLPEKWHGVRDPEVRYRQRYLDLIIDDDSRDRFRKRFDIIKAIRQLLWEKGFVEVETPILQPIPSGASARPFVTHHNALDIDLYLRIAPELYLKRLVVGGIHRVFELGKNFRNEGIDQNHNPEFTMLELYQTPGDYEDMIKITEDIMMTAAEVAGAAGSVNFKGMEVHFQRPFKRITFRDAFSELANLDWDEINTLDKALKVIEEKNLEMTKTVTWANAIQKLFDELVQPKLIDPTFVIDYPVDISPLAKRKTDESNFVYRFELFMAGMEMANAFSELQDPVDQKSRFEEQMRLKEAGEEEVILMDEDFVTALEYGLPPTGGLGIGIDRLIMLLTQAENIKDVILFPTLRPKLGEEELTDLENANPIQ